MQKKVNQILESGASRFDNMEQALEERATVFQLSELSETVESLVKRVSSLEKENSELRESRCRCEEQGSRENPIEIVDSEGVPYELAEEDEVLPTVPSQVLPAVSGQRCRPSVPFASRLHYPSVSPADGVTRTVSRIRSARMVFAKAVHGLESSREQRRRIRQWRQCAENKLDCGYVSSSDDSDDDSSASTDWSSLGRSSCSFTSSSRDDRASGVGSNPTDRSIGYAADEGGNRRGIGFAGGWESDKENLRGDFSSGAVEP